MKKTFTLFFVFILGLSCMTAQTALDPNQFVNTQITAPGVYTVEAGQFYAFDGRIDLTFDITIIGPDNGWIKNATNPPVLVNTPSADGAARDFFEIKEGGSLTLKNVLFSGNNNNAEIGGTFVANTGGSKMIVDNCAFADWQNFALRNQNKGDSISITNSVFVNGVRLRNSPWGGFPLRMDVACDNVILENNSVVNSGRLTANSGPFDNATIHEMHNTYVNQTVAGHEQRANEMITANNIFYNYHFLGRRTDAHSAGASNTYDASFTTWNYFADSKDDLDNVSLYLGQNLFYRDPTILEWFNTVGGDSIAASLLWEHADVDSFIIADANYTIGTNYAELDPGFAVPPGNTQAIVNYINGTWVDPTADWVDWRSPSPVTFNSDGLPVLSWPLAFDLSYENSNLQKAGTDGLPLGDLNWFPDKKAEFLANKGAIVTSLRDSIVNAMGVYDPTTMDATPMITSFPPPPPPAQVIALDPNQFVNAQITGPGIYTAAAGQSFAFDGRIDLTYDVTIIAPYEGWIVTVPSPPVFVNTPSADGAARDFFEIKEGGSLTLKNILLSGSNSNAEVGGTFAANTGGSKMIVDNCAFADWQNFALRNQNKGDSISITNSVFINGVRLRNSPWGGFPLRMDVACDNVVLENNSVVNSGRLTANSGPFDNAIIHEMHNTYVNQAVAGHEQRALEMITANNIFYNYHFLGRRTDAHSAGASNTYDASFTTWNYFADSKDNLDNVSLYLGQNLFYRDPAISEWFNTVGGDSLATSLLWEHADVDSFIIADANYTIGTNYAELEPEFTAHPGNTEAIVGYINGTWVDPTADWVDWRVESPVSFNGDGFPVLNWPPAFDLSYANENLRTAGSDGLPLGDLNWYPDKKAEFMANRGAIVTSLRDSIVNAMSVYDPTTMDATPLITSFSTTSTKETNILNIGLANYPNPFREATQIALDLKASANIELRVFDAVGKVVATQREQLAAGKQVLNFENISLSQGMYFFSVYADGLLAGTGKMMVK